MTLEIPEHLNPKLKKLFRDAFAKGMTRRDIATSAGLHFNAAYSWYTGDSEPTISSYDAAVKGVRKWKPNVKKRKSKPVV